MVRTRKLKVYYQNVNGLKTKVNDLRSSILEANYDVIALCETNLNESFHSEELFDDRYVIYRKDRDLNIVTKKASGGGCLIAVKSNFSSNRIYEWETIQEDIWVSVAQENGEKLFINVRYIPLN